MNKFDKDWTYWFVVWVILAILFVFFLGFGTARVFATDASVEECSQTIPTICLKQLTASELQDPLISTKKELEIDSVETAEPLYGPDLYRFYISQIHEQYYPDVDPYIVLAVLEIESNYKPDLTSSAGAIGLMQWIPKWHAYRMVKFHLNDMWDPYTNIIVGMDYLNDLYLSTESWRESLYGYNHSIAYVNAVLSKAESLREGGYFG